LISAESVNAGESRVSNPQSRISRRYSRYVVGPDGLPLTLADLPAVDTIRWVIFRKAQVVSAVKGGLLSMDQACAQYRLSLDEFLSWKSAIEKHGLKGLRATRIQDYRCPPSE